MTEPGGDDVSRRMLAQMAARHYELGGWRLLAMAQRGM